MLKISGSQAVLPKSFYDACDEFGILLYHNPMFIGEQNHGANRSQDVNNVVIHILRKLSAHPSTVVCSGCYECTYGGESMDVYESFVMQTDAYEDDTWNVWPRGPSAFGSNLYYWRTAEWQSSSSSKR
jgi:hypothetical protein